MLGRSVQDMKGDRIRAYVPHLVAFILLSLGLLATFIALLLPNPYSYAISISTIVGSIGGILLLNFRLVSISLNGLKDRNITKVLAIVYLITFFILFINYVPGQSRNLSVHLSQLFLYIVCATSIFLGLNRRFSFSLLIVTGLIHRLSLYWASASQIGLDALFHSRMVESLVEIGSLQPLINNKYYYAPFQHIFVAAGELLFGSSTRVGGMVLVIGICLVTCTSIYAVSARIFTGTVGLTATYFAFVSDYFTDWAVQVTPTTMGYIFFTTTLLILVLIVDNYRARYVLLFVGMVGSQTLTHQISTLATVLLIVAFLGGWSIYRGQYTDISLAARTTIWAGFILLLDWIVTRRRGPAGDFPPFLTEMIQNFVATAEVAEETGGRPTPPSIGLGLAGSETLSLLQVSGFIIMFSLAAGGTIQALRSNKRQSSYIFGIGAVIAGIGLMLFPAPALGINFFLPNRWFLFFYIPVSIAAGYMAVYLHSIIREITPPSKKTVITLGFIIVLISPYTALMTLAFPGANDGPVFDDSPGAYRLTTEPGEDALYQHTASYASSDDITAGDHVSRQLVERHYGHETEYFIVNDTTGEPLYDDFYFVDRNYTRSKHVSFLVHTNRNWRVFGPIPVDREKMMVLYDNGGNSLRYSSA